MDAHVDREEATEHDDRPLYSGLVLFFVGVGLALGNWASLLVLALVPTLGLLVRIHSEERALLAGLGEDYRRYTATHSRLFPGIW
jgi:protein-S-isoprenylcysteine O-methyltransferase Ste14